MTGDKLLISCMTSDKDIGCLSSMLQTLTVCPPTIPWDIVVIGEPGESGKTATYCSQSNGVKFIEATNDHGDILDSMAGDDANLRLLVHPDVLFISNMWCDAIFSKMLDVGAAMVGATPFIDIDIGERKLPSFSPWFIAWDNSYMKRVGGFSGTHLGRWAWSAAYLRARNAGMQCVGADINGLAAHLGVCLEDTCEDDMILKTRAETLATIVSKESMSI